MHELVLSFLPTYTIFIIFFLPLDTQFPSVFELEITSQFEKILSVLKGAKCDKYGTNKFSFLGKKNKTKFFKIYVSYY